MCCTPGRCRSVASSRAFDPDGSAGEVCSFHRDRASQAGSEQPITGDRNACTQHRSEEKRPIGAAIPASGVSINDHACAESISHSDVTSRRWAATRPCNRASMASSRRSVPLRWEADRFSGGWSDSTRCSTRSTLVVSDAVRISSLSHSRATLMDARVACHSQIGRLGKIKRQGCKQVVVPIRSAAPFGQRKLLIPKCLGYTVVRLGLARRTARRGGRRARLWPPRAAGVRGAARPG